ncbi:MAG: hypothetical protein CMJ66_05775 [Planctomycetaceae bacterium]|nr:hypothetical protein [Planctomycetaceae bacterium]
MKSMNTSRLSVLLFLFCCLKGGFSEAFSATRPENAASLPELVRTTQRQFAIPFRLPKPDTPDATVEKVEMNVSTDFGLSWRAAGSTSPPNASIPFKADTDGEYWFRIRAIDRKNRSRGSEGPDARVLVDAAAPRLTGRAWKGSDGEILCRYAAVDDSINLDSILFQYRQLDGDWKTIATEPVLSRSSPAHLIGEEIWWAGQDVSNLTVKISVADAAGHRTTQQFSMLPSDPQVSQADLANEITAPALPSPLAGSRLAGSSPSNNHQTKSVMLQNRPQGKKSDMSWEPTLGTSWSGGEPVGSAQPSPTQSGTIKTNTTKNTTEVAKKNPLLTISSPTLAAAIKEKLRHPELSQNQETGFVAEYRGSPLHLMRVQSFSWEYSFNVPEDLQGPFRVELWSTQDGGHSWERLAVDKDTTSPIDVKFSGEGLFGCRLEIVRDVPGTPIPPRAGASPSTWIGIDSTPPQATSLDVVTVKKSASDAFEIHYSFEDPLAIPDRVRLSYSPHRSGPWATIASDQAASGHYNWKPHRSLPSRVYVRIEMPDAAGNVGESITQEPITLRTARFVGTLGSPRATTGKAP